MAKREPQRYALLVDGKPVKMFKGKPNKQVRALKKFAGITIEPKLPEDVAPAVADGQPKLF